MKSRPMSRTEVFVLISCIRTNALPVSGIIERSKASHSHILTKQAAFVCKPIPCDCHLEKFLKETTLVTGSCVLLSYYKALHLSKIFL